MKGVFFSICLLSAVNCAFGQQSDTLPSLTPVDFLQKSKRQKTGAWLLFGTGGTILVMTFGKTVLNNPTAFPVFPVLLGAGSMIGSFSLFHASIQNRRKARDVSVEFYMQRATTVQTAVWGDTHVPTLSLKIKR